MNKSKYSLSYLSKKFQVLLVKNLRIVRTALATESKETAVMLKTYIEYSQGKAPKKEMALANKQFRNLLKTAGLGALAVLPFAPITIPLLVKLGEKVGIDILPPSIRNQIND